MSAFEMLAIAVLLMIAVFGLGILAYWLVCRISLAELARYERGAIKPRLEGRK